MSSRRSRTRTQSLSGRKAWEDWIDLLVKDSVTQTKLLYIFGMGGVGKTSVLARWHEKNRENAIFIQFLQNDSLDSALKRFIQLCRMIGYELPLFDRLWSLKLIIQNQENPVLSADLSNSKFREMIGNEFKFQVQEEAKRLIVDGIKEYVAIGPISISNAERFYNWLKRNVNQARFKPIGQWLMDNLGDDFIDEWRKILTNPDERVFQYELLMKAIAFDLNSQADNRPLLLLLDHFDYISEEEIQIFWLEFLSSLENIVGIFSGETRLSKSICSSIPRWNLKEPLELVWVGIGEIEIQTLDKAGSDEVLVSQGYSDSEVHRFVWDFCKGHPTWLRLICDGLDSGLDIEELRLQNSWELVFESLLKKLGDELRTVLLQVSLIPFFNRYYIGCLSSQLTDRQWKKLESMSFVIKVHNQEDRYEIHNLVRNLLLKSVNSNTIMKELMSLKLTEKLHESYELVQDPILLGFALSVESFTKEWNEIAHSISNYTSAFLDSKEIDIKEKYDKAIMMLTVPVFKNPILEAIRFTQMAMLSYTLGRYVLAIKYYSDAERILISIDNVSPDVRDYVAIALFIVVDRISEIFLRTRNFSSAIEKNEYLIANYKLSPERIANIYGYLINCYLHVEDFKKAESLIDKAEILSKSDDVSLENKAEICNGIGNYYRFRALGQTVISKDFQKRLRSRKLISKQEEDVFNDLELALKYLKDGLSFRQQVVDEKPESSLAKCNLADSFHNVSVIQKIIGDAKSCEEFLKCAIAIYDNNKDHLDYFQKRISSTRELAALLEIEGRIDESHDTFEEAFRLLEDQNYFSRTEYNIIWQEAQNRLSRGLFYKNHEDWELAIIDFEKALKLILNFLVMDPRAHFKRILLVVHSLSNSYSKFLSCSDKEALSKVFIIISNRLAELESEYLIDQLVNSMKSGEWIL